MTYVTRETTTAVGIIFPCLAVTCFAMRMQVQRRYSDKIEIDAMLVIPALVLTIGTGIALVVGAQLGILGGHEMSQEIKTGIAKFEYAFWPPHIWAMGFIKLSILFFFRRVFKGRAYRTPFDYANWTLITITALWTVAFFFADILACGTDPSSAWRSAYSLRHECIKTFSMMAACGISSWILDLAILVEPLVVIKQLKMNSKRKIQASLMFLFSIFAVIAGLLRMIILAQIEVQDSIHPTIMILGTELVSKDSVGVVSILLFWTYVEIGVGFVVACLLPSARLFDKLSLKPIIKTSHYVVSRLSFQATRVATSFRFSALRTKPLVVERHPESREKAVSSEISDESWEKLKHLRDPYLVTNLSVRNEQA